MNTPKIILTAMLWVVSFTAFSQTVSHEFYFLESEFQTMIVDDFTTIACISDDYYLKEEPGKPALPVRSIKLMIPSDAKYLSHSIKERVVPYLEECTVFPMQPPVPTDGAISQWVKPDSSIYDGNGVFPKEKSQFSGMHIMGNYRIITIEYCPFKYYPKENRVELVSRLDLTIELGRDQKPKSRYENEIHFKLVKSVVDNPQDVTYTSGRSPVNPNDVKYLIITDANMIDDFQPLADWKTQKGVPAEVISIQSVLANYTGATDQLKIKTCLQDYYLNKGLQWVLLGGDNTIVPDQDCYGIVNANSSTPSIDNTIPTDLFYCCFDNAFDWNADGDNQVGEVEDNVDMAPEIFIGRAPVQTESQAAIFVAKTLNYEQNPPTNNFASKFVSSGLQLWNNWGGHSDAYWRSEAMWNEVIAPIWTGTKYKYYDTDTDFPGGEYFDVTQQNTVDILNDGYNIFWMATHGGQQAWGMESGDGFYSSSASALTNYMRQSLVVTMACNTNAFETSKYGNDPCLSEAFLRNGNGGAVMYHGSSRYGWGNGSAVINHGSSMEYARDFFYALFSGNPTSNPQAFAAVSAESKLDNIGNAADANSFRWLMFAINNMGDPELPILTQNPSSFVASMPAHLLYGVSQNVVVSTGVPGALVCVMDTNAVTPVYAYGYADSNGDCSLQMTPNQDYPLTVTLSAPNYHPLVSTINIISPSDPLVVVDEIIPSTNNGDAMLEAGETAYFDVRIINVGGVTANNIVMQLAKTDPDNFITLTDSNETVTQSLPSGDTLVVSAAFSLDVAMDVTNNYGVTLSTGISFSSKDMTWYPQDFTVYSYINPVFLTAISGNQRVDLSWRAPFGGWKSYYNGGGWLTNQYSQRAMLYHAADFDLSYPMEISRLASSFYESESWGDSNTFRFNIYDASTEELIYQTHWIVANSYGYTYHILDYPITLTNDFYLAVEVNDLTNRYPVSVISAPMEPEDTHSYVGAPGNWTKCGFECSNYIYVMDAGSTAMKELSYQQNQLSQQSPAPDLTLGKGPKFSFQGYNIYRDGVKTNSTLITDNSYTDEPLLTGLYSYYVTAVYAEGESCASNEVVAAGLDENTVFYDHFSGTNFWTCDQGCSWNVTADDFYSATESYTDSPDGNYQDNMDCSTWTATPVSLMNVNAELATVSYYAKYAIEEDFDTCFFEIATDINGSREVLGSFTGINNVWTEYSFDISNYIGSEAVYFIFRMNTDEMINDDGIYIDDFLVTVSENGFSPARNIEAFLYDMDVHLSWSPPMAGGEGWFSHWRWNTHYSLLGDEKGAYINLAEFGNAYPMMLTKIRHHFYDPANNNWNGNNRFTFRIYNKNGIDLVYESPQLEAVAWENEYTLPVPFELTDDVLIAVAPVSSSGGPYSLTQHDFGNTSRSYIGDASMGWSHTNGNWATEIYITNSSKSGNAFWSQSGIALQNVNSSLADMAMLPVPAEDLKKAPRFTGNQNLAKNVQGYNVFRDGDQLNGALVTDNWFMDDLPYQGQYSYTVRAVYSGGESVETMPQFIELDDVVVMIPSVASAFDEVTLWFDPAYSCEAGSGSSLEGFGEVWMHSGIGINGTTWNNTVFWDDLGANSQTPQMVLNGNGQASITYTPSEFYGTSVDQSLQDQLCMVLNGGNLAQAQFGNPWSKTGKATDEYGNSTDIFIPLEYRDTLFMDDFESGIAKWLVTGDWALCETDFFSPTHSLTDSPNGNYSFPSDTYAAMANPIDLSQKSNIVLEFKTIFGLAENDLVYVEISNDDFVSSEVLYTFSYNNWKPWDKVQIGLDDYSGFDNVKIRFHMVVQNMGTNDGIFIDDVLIKAVDGYFVIEDLIAHTTDGDGDFEANETGTIDVVIVNGGALTLSNVPLILSKTDADGYITLIDNVCTIESMNPGERDTIFDAFSLDVAIGVTDFYPFTLSVGADIPSEDMTWFDFSFTAYSDIYPVNFVAENGNGEVDLSWYAPFRGWYSYQYGGNNGTDKSEEERGVLYTASDFGLTYPMYFTTIAHRFYEVEADPWNGNNKFRYNIYDYATNDLLFESEWLYAPSDDYFYYTFPEPYSVNGDFIIAVEVFDAGGTNFPSSARNDGTTWPTCHSYLGSGGTWTTYPHEWMTHLYVTGDGGTAAFADGMAVGYNSGSPSISVPDGSTKGGTKSDIIGFNIYRDGSKINGDTPVDGYSYTDTPLAVDNYGYFVTAVYAEGESCPSNSDNAYSLEEHVVFFEDFEGYNEEDWNCGWDFTNADAYSGNTSLANGPWGNYQNDQDCWVKIDPPINLFNVNADSAVLSFYAKYDIELDFDTCYVEISNDFGGGQREALGYFTGQANSWQQYSFDISDYLGDQIVIVFRFVSDAAISFDGIYIDDIAVSVYDNNYAPPRNVEANAYASDVHLKWNWPMAGGEGWFSNWSWSNTSYFNWGEKASYIDLAEFGNPYPMLLTKVRHQFIDWEGTNWNGENEFKIRVWEKDGQTLIFESEVLYASHGSYEYELSEPLELTDDVLVTIKPMNVYPTSAYMSVTNNTGHGYLGNPDEGWEPLNGNWATEIYLAYCGAKDNTSGKWLQAGIELENVIEPTNPSGKQTLTAEMRDSLPVFKGNTALAKSVSGFNAYRDGQQINTTVVANDYYYDTLPHQGVYDYYVKAVYPGDELSVRTSITTVMVDDVVLMYPLDATPDEELSLVFDPAYSCEAGNSNSLEGSSEVRLHSGVTLNGIPWSSTKQWGDTGDNGQSTYLTPMVNGQYSYTYNTSLFYGVNPDVDEVAALDMVFNGGNSTPDAWDLQGHAPDGSGGCIDVNIPLNYRSVLFEDDFESGMANWVTTGTWNASTDMFFTATHCLSDSPWSWYSGGTETTATLATGLDLSGYSSPVLEYNILHVLDNGDHVYVDISTDDFANFTVLKEYAYYDWLPWLQESISLDLYENQSNVKIRFRLVTDNVDDGDGVFIDDVKIKGYQSSLVIEPIPYTQDFAVYPTPDWEQYEGQLTASSVLVPYNGIGDYDGWHEDGFNCHNTSGTGAIRGNIWSANHYYWYNTPFIDLGTNTGGVILRFDMAGSYWNSCALANLAANDQFAVVISTDGVTWSSANTLIEWVEGDTLPEYGETYEVDLSAYSGMVKFGFYHGHNGSSTDLEVFVDNVYVGLDYSPITIAEARALPVGSTVCVEGIVTNGGEFGNIRYLQDATGAIAAYGAAQNGSVYLGDEVIYEGELYNYYELLEISPIYNFEIQNSGQPLPLPINVEPYQWADSLESHLMVVDTGYFLKSNNVWSSRMFPSGDTLLFVTPGYDTAALFVDPNTDLDQYYIPDCPVAITGILGQYSSDPDEGFQLLPRQLNDFENVAIAPSDVQTDVSSNDVTLSWNSPIYNHNIPGLNEYIIYYNTSGTFSESDYHTTVYNEDPVIINDLENGLYYFWIKAVYDNTLDVLSDSVIAQVDYEFVLSGLVTDGNTGLGIPDVEMVFSNGVDPGPLFTDATGYYEATVPGETYIYMQPEHECYSFSPYRYYNYSGLTADSVVDFSATLNNLNISGSVLDTAGNAVKYINVHFVTEGTLDTVTTSSGYFGSYYNYQIPCGWSGWIIPEYEHYSFDPDSIVVNDVTSNLINQDFVAECDTSLTVSGIVSDDGVPLAGCTIIFNNWNSFNDTVYTDASGYYQNEVLWNFDGYLKALKDDYVFSPGSVFLNHVQQDLPDQDIEANYVPIEITGVITYNGAPLSGVQVRPDYSTTATTGHTDDDGFFTVKAPIGYSGFITPNEYGYAFEPDTIFYDNLTANIDNQDFEAFSSHHMVSGTVTADGVGLEGVQIYFPFEGSAYTDAQGDYSYQVPHGYDWNIRASKEYYRFEPNYIDLGSVLADTAGNDFTGFHCPHKITGIVTLDGDPFESVYMYANNNAVSGITDEDGNYTVYVPEGWSGTIEPGEYGYDFTPESIPYSNVTAVIDSQDYAATNNAAYTISGTITDGTFYLEGVTVTLSDSKQTTQTASDGTYSFTVSHGYSGTITPSMPYYTFAPEDISVTNVTANSTDNDFVGTATHYPVSGTITFNGQPLEGVKVNVGSITPAPYTAADGTYLCYVPAGWSGAIMPYKQHFTFAPQFINVPEVDAPVPDQDFTASHDPLFINGVVKEGEYYIQGVEMVVTDGSGGVIETVYTNSVGYYDIDVPYGFTGTVTPNKADFNFNPTERIYNNLESSTGQQNYEAINNTQYTISGIVTDGSDPIEGATMTLSESKTTTLTASDGSYSFTVARRSSGTIMPSKDGYSFTPESESFSNITTNISSFHFTGSVEEFAVSGTVTLNGSPLSGVLLDFDNIANDPVSASDGTYSCIVPYGWSGHITPSLSGYSFDPAYHAVGVVTTPVSNQDFEAIEGNGLPPGWNFVNTGSNHTINIIDTAPMIDGVPLSYGSWIGVFFDDNGVEKCAGANEWQGAASPIIAAQGDDSTTPGKDGFSEGEVITYKFYTNDVKGTEMYATATYSSGPEVYTTNGTSVIPLLQASTSMTHTVQLPEGWSGVSSYIVPDNDSTSVIFAPVLDDFVILKSMTQAYWPPYANQIDHWNPYEGYKLKLNAGGDVNFVGGDTEKTLAFGEGWCLLPVLTNQNVDATALFAPVIDNLIIAKTIGGMGVYWPAVGVQTLLSLAPGESYMVKFSGQSILSYPPLSSKSTPPVKGYPNPVVCDMWESPVNTGNTHIIAFSDDASQVIENGDFVGVFDINDRCVGLSEFSDTATLMISVYGDDPTTPEKDGLFYDEAFVVKVYNPTINEIKELLMEYEQNMDVAYREDGLTLITKTTVATTGIGSLNLRFTKVYPNPTSDIIHVYVPGSETISLTARVIASNGGAILTELEFNGQCAINVHSFPAGVYLIQISDEINDPVYRRFIKK